MAAEPPAEARERAARLKAALPDALRLLMTRQGTGSLRATSRRLGEATGSTLTPMALSLWARGEATPSYDNLVDFLVGLGLDLADLGTAVDEVLARQAEEADGLARLIATRLREHPTLRTRLASLSLADETDADLLLSLLAEEPATTEDSAYQAPTPRKRSA